MICPECGGGTHVINTDLDRPADVKRRRECLVCGLRFNTYERVIRAELHHEIMKKRRNPQ